MRSTQLFLHMLLHIATMIISLHTSKLIQRWYIPCRKMSIQKEYEELALDGHNYLIWAMDMKICLHSCGLNGVLNEPEAGIQRL